MFGDLLTKIGGALEKDFLFGAFIPALIFLTAIGLTIILVIGIEPVSTMISTLSTVNQIMAGTVATLGIIVFAYVMTALRGGILRFWTGNSMFPLGLPWGLVKLGESLQRERYQHLRSRAQRISRWPEILEQFRVNVDKKWEHRPMAIATGADILLLLSRVRQISPTLSEKRLERELASIIEAYGAFDGDSLCSVYEGVKRRLLDWAEEEDTRIQGDCYYLDRNYGCYASIRATKLGNIIDSYNHYSYKRYKIEGEVFWPRMQRVIPDSYIKLVDEPRILMDFSLAMTTLSTGYALFAIVIGPWLWYNFQLWLCLAIAGMAFALFFYRVSVGAAFKLGEMIRSSYDLFRLDLLAALDRPRPDSYQKEQEMWSELSRVAVYGSDLNFDFKIIDREAI